MSVHYKLNGVDLVVPDDLNSDHLREKIESGWYERSEARAAARRIRPGQRVLEVGAGLGYVTTLCARAAGPENVLSVEANPRMIEVIRSNLERNGCGEVTLIHAAVTGRAKEGETATFHTGQAFWGGALARREDAVSEEVTVPLVSIRSLLKAHKPQVVILDIEGAEADLFQRPWPRFVQHVVMELHPDRYKDDSVVPHIIRSMAEAGLTYDHRTSNGKVLGFRRIRLPARP